MEKIKLDPFISELLYDHDCVIIADFGGFVANFKSSYLHPAQHTISPPSKRIAFNSSLKMNDGLLASYIAENNSITYFEACKLITKYVEESLNLLETGRKLQLDKIGSLFYNSDKNLQFSPDLSTNYLHESFGLTAVHSPAIMRENPVKKTYDTLPYIKKESKEKITKKHSRSWKWLELIPAAAVLTLLLLNPAIVKNLNDNIAGCMPEMHFSNPFKDIFENKITTGNTPENQNSFVSDTLAETNANTTAIENTTQPDAIDVNTDPDENSKILTSVENAETEESPSKDAENAIDETVSDNENTKEINKPDVVSTTVSENTTQLYYLVAGCFRIEENAKALHQDLISKGYDSELIGKIKGLHVVTFQHTASYDEAHTILEKLSEKQIESWVLKQ